MKENEMTKKYIGTKIVTAFEQRDPLGVPVGATPEKGYGVIYEDGYQSWSPASAFESAYRAIEGAGQALTFGDAIYLLKQGKKLARAGWNGKGLWIELQRPDAHSKMTLPYIFMAYPSTPASDTAPDSHINARVPWLASQTDMLAEDWMVVE